MQQYVNRRRRIILYLPDRSRYARETMLATIQPGCAVTLITDLRPRLVVGTEGVVVDVVEDMVEVERPHLPQANDRLTGLPALVLT